MKKLVVGPTFEEMLHPEKIPEKIRTKALKMKKEDPLDPINLFNISWKNEKNEIYYFVVPKALTGVKANIVMLYSKDFPTGSHKVGASYASLVDEELFKDVEPGKHRIVWPSTGNYGIGGSWVGCRMNFECIVILPEMMSEERFKKIESYGGKVIRTPGCESNVKEIYDKSKELKAADPENIRVINQFEAFGNYRFHYYVTGNTVVELADVLKKKGVGKGEISAFVSSMGSAGTIAAADRIKQVFPKAKSIGSEPIQCPTVMINGYGGHDIQGIGDKHVTWIHNVMNMDAMVAVDDMESKLGLQLLTDPEGVKFLTANGISKEDAKMMSGILGISGVCNLYSAIKTAKYYDMDENDVVVTVATDAIDRYGSVMEDLNRQFGELNEKEVYYRFKHLFLGVKTDWFQEGTYLTRKRWHNLKYYTWVEQQGKTVEELNAQLKQDYWEGQQARVGELNDLILRKREEMGI